MDVQVARARLEDVPRLIDKQDLAFRENFECYEVCPSYREHPAAMRDMIRNPSV